MKIGLLELELGDISEDFLVNFDLDRFNRKKGGLMSKYMDGRGVSNDADHR